MNEKILLRIDQIQYIIIHIPKRIYHVVIFGVTQARGVKESFHYLKIRPFGEGCTIKLRRWLGKQNTISNKETASCLNFDFYDYSDNRLDLIK